MIRQAPVSLNVNLPSFNRERLTQTAAHGINDTGQIVGQYDLPNPNNVGNLGYAYNGGGRSVLS
jgi:hypothetical protein